MTPINYAGRYKRARNAIFLRCVQNFAKFPADDPYRVSKIAAYIDGLSRADITRITAIDPGPPEVWNDHSNAGERHKSARARLYLKRLHVLGVPWSRDQYNVLAEIMLDADAEGFAKFRIPDVCDALAVSRDTVLEALATLSEFDPTMAGETLHGEEPPASLGRDCGPWKDGVCYQLFIPQAFGSQVLSRIQAANEAAQEAAGDAQPSTLDGGRATGGDLPGDRHTRPELARLARTLVRELEGGAYRRAANVFLVLVGSGCEDGWRGLDWPALKLAAGSRRTVNRALDDLVGLDIIEIQKRDDGGRNARLKVSRGVST